MSCPRALGLLLVAALLAQGPLLAGPRGGRSEGRGFGPTRHFEAREVPVMPRFQAAPRIQAAPSVRLAEPPRSFARPPLAGNNWVPRTLVVPGADIRPVRLFGFATYGWGFRPLYWSPAWGWGFGWGYDPGYWGYYDTAREGRVQIKTNRKDAVVNINGAYAGTAGDLKSIWLEPGTYDFDIRVSGAEPFNTRIYVLAGKTVKLRPEF